MADSTADINPEDNNAHLVYIPAGVFAVICPVLMGLRVWARLRHGGKMGADDWTAIAALVSLPHDIWSSCRAIFLRMPLTCGLDIHTSYERLPHGL